MVLMMSYVLLTPKAPALTKNICKLFYDNKAIEKINLFCIFHDPFYPANISMLDQRCFNVVD